MRIFKLNKLVRDKVFDEMLQMGQRPEYKILSDEVYKKELRRKLDEEVNELEATKEKALTELADILEVVEALAETHGQSLKEVIKKQQTLKRKRGSFGRKVFVGKLVLEDSDPWADYYAKDPKKFPEVKHKEGK